MSVRALSPGIAYQRAADVRVERTLERVLVSLLCADTDSVARVTELLVAFSVDFAGVVAATETAGVVV